MSLLSIIENLSPLATIITSATLATLTGWLSAFFAIRKDERAIYIKQVTEERTKWREDIRQLTETIIDLDSKNLLTNEKGLMRTKLSIRLNPLDEDNQILTAYDTLNNTSDKQQLFTQEIALVLKQDWERVKWESMPFYMKWFSYLFFSNSLNWKATNFRNLSENNNQLKFNLSTHLFSVLMVLLVSSFISIIFAPIIKITSPFLLMGILIGFFIFRSLNRKNKK